MGEVVGRMRGGVGELKGLEKMLVGGGERKRVWLKISGEVVGLYD